MRRLWLNVGVSLAALGLGVAAYLQGQTALGLCFAGLGILRAVATLTGRRPNKPPEPSVTLNLDDPGDED